MAKKKKNANYNGAYRAETKSSGGAVPPRQRKSIEEAYGMPKWAFFACLICLGVSFALYALIKDTEPGWLTVLTYFMTGTPAAILGMGQHRLTQEDKGNKLLKWLLLAVATVYLLSGMLLTAQLLRG